VHLYVDTGMHRMGLPHEQLLAWLESADLRRAISIEGAFTELVEDQEFDREQVARLTWLAESARSRGVSFGRLHAASSDAVVRPTPETFLDLIRPGLALYGGYPLRSPWRAASCGQAIGSGTSDSVDLLQPGDGVSYHRRSGGPSHLDRHPGIRHVDGYPAGAVKGCEVLIESDSIPWWGRSAPAHRGCPR
jgi:alanine racemase